MNFQKFGAPPRGTHHKDQIPQKESIPTTVLVRPSLFKGVSEHCAMLFARRNSQTWRQLSKSDPFGSLGSHPQEGALTYPSQSQHILDPRSIWPCRFMTSLLQHLSITRRELTNPPQSTNGCRSRLGSATHPVIHQRAESFELPGLLACVLTYQDLAE